MEYPINLCPGIHVYFQYPGCAFTACPTLQEIHEVEFLFNGPSLFMFASASLFQRDVGRCLLAWYCVPRPPISYLQQESLTLAL